MFPPGAWEVLLIVGVIVLLFGAKRIPELAKSLGTGIREFKTGLKEIDKDQDEENKKIDQSDDV